MIKKIKKIMFKKITRKEKNYQAYLITLNILDRGLSSHNQEMRKYFVDNEIQEVITKSLKFLIFSFWYTLYDFTNRYFYGFNLVERYKLPYFLFWEKYNFPYQKEIKVGKKIIDNIHLWLWVKARQYRNPDYYKIFTKK